MGYVEKVLQPNEQIAYVAKLHWMIYLKSWFQFFLAILVFGAFAFNVTTEPTYKYAVLAVGGLLAISGIFEFLRAFIRQFTTEVAVTDKRVIRKVGLIARETEEMNINQVESVEVSQSVIARILDYGTIQVNGTGHGMEKIKFVRDPLGLRSSITAR